MVKQSPFQKDLFDFSYIENQVKNIKKSMNKSDETVDETVSEQTLTDLLNDQITILQEVKSLLEKIDKNTEKRGLFNTK